jgi:L-alanine-DL-glutamate epimerase-like enolase superfamily enzyme
MDIAQSPTRVRTMRVVPLNIALSTPFGISRGSLETAANVLVAVELADGTTGYGEAAPFPAYNGETQLAATEALTRAAAWLPGRDASDWRALAAQSGGWSGTACGSARCALETALVDAVARRDGVPLWRIFGGAGTELRTDMTVTTGSPGEAADAARAIRSRGIRVIKAKVGGREGSAADLERISAILEAAPGSPLVLDGNAAMGRRQAWELVSGLKERGITPALLEQWLPRDDLEGMRLLGAESGWTVAADEGVASAEDAEKAVAARAASVFNVKLMKAGILEALRVVAIARGAGIGLMIGGNVESILGMTASACFAAGLGGFEFADLDTPFFMAENPFEGGYRVEGDRVSVAHIAAGHGVSPRGLLL